MPYLLWRRTLTRADDELDDDGRLDFFAETFFSVPPVWRRFFFATLAASRAAFGSRRAMLSSESFL